MPTHAHKVIRTPNLYGTRKSKKFEQIEQNNANKQTSMSTYESAHKLGVT